MFGFHSNFTRFQRFKQGKVAMVCEFLRGENRLKMGVLGDLEEDYREKKLP